VASEEEEVKRHASERMDGERLTDRASGWKRPTSDTRSDVRHILLPKKGRSRKRMTKNETKKKTLDGQLKNETKTQKTLKKKNGTELTNGRGKTANAAENFCIWPNCLPCEFFSFLTFNSVLDVQSFPICYRT
jgi:hypothetical protein